MTSAPVEAVTNYWDYFYQVQLGMPTNCSKDVNLVIDYIDNFLMTGDKSEKASLKEMFGLSAFEDDDCAR